MASKIEWTGSTWNPIVGCSIHSPGCRGCYAMPMAARLERMGVEHYAGLTAKVKGKTVWTGELRLAPESILLKPLQARKPTTWFVNSMSDLFHEKVPDAWIDRVFAVMALAPQHTFQVLTKRADRMRDFLGTRAGDWWSHWPDAARKAGALLGDMPSVGREMPWPLPNVWLGVSAERQQEADERIPDLLATPAAVRFLSAEPLLGPVDLDHYLRAASHRYVGPITAGALQWVIVGGESGPDARPMHPDWARSLRDQCAAAGVPFFHKQNGAWAPGSAFSDHIPSGTSHDFGDPTLCDDERVWLVGKKRAGRLLDGVEHNGMPEVHHA